MKDNYTIRRTAQERENNAMRQLQAEHRLERLKRRQEYQKARGKRQRDERTHQLCCIAGVIEHFYPEIKSFTEQEFYELVDELNESVEVRSRITGGIEAVMKRRAEGGG